MLCKHVSARASEQAFRKIGESCIQTCIAMISAKVKLGRGEEALDFYTRMQLAGLSESKSLHLVVLRACVLEASLAQGRLLHERVMKTGLDNVIGATLVEMYATCGSLKEAQDLFEKFLNPDVVLWGSMLAGYVQHGKADFALECFGEMLIQDIYPNKTIYLCILKASTSSGAISHGRLVHNLIIKCGLTDTVILSSLLGMYVKSKNIEEAYNLFEILPKRSIVSWNTIIAAYLQLGHGILALELYEDMQEEVKPDKITFLSVLKACSNIGGGMQGRLIHSQIICNGLAADIFIGSALVDMYAKCSSLLEACKVFRDLPSADVVLWGSLITGYAQQGEGNHALELFDNMQQHGIQPSKVSFLSVLKACGSMRSIEQGRLVHSQILGIRALLDIEITNSLVDMYGKSGSLEEAHMTFEKAPHRSVVTWNALIAGCAEHGYSLLVQQHYDKMQQAGVAPNKVTYLSILKACTKSRSLDWGHCIHKQVALCGLINDVVIGSTLVDMYAKCGSLEEAREVFDSMLAQNVVSWNAIIAGYAENEQGVPALELFEKMQEKAMKPDKVTFLSILKACASLGAIEQGRAIHFQIIRNRLLLGVMVGSAVVDMYAKCGSMEEACIVFESLPIQNVITWGAMIEGYAQKGDAGMAWRCLHDMHQRGIKADEVTFSSALAACSNTGLVDEGRWYIKSMRANHGLTPDVRHYTCMADLLSRAGCLYEAETLLEGSDEPDILGWTSLLNSCKVYHNVDLARRCFKKVIYLDPNFAGGYVLMSNIFSDAHLRHDVPNLQNSGASIAGLWMKFWED